MLLQMALSCSFLWLSSIALWLPRWLSGKESTCSAGDAGSIPGSGRSPGGGNGNPLQYSWLKNPMDREAWQVTVQGSAKSQAQVKRLSTQHKVASLMSKPSPRIRNCKCPSIAATLVLEKSWRTLVLKGSEASGLPVLIRNRCILLILNIKKPWKLISLNLTLYGLPGWLSGKKNLPTSSRTSRDTGSTPGWKDPLEEEMAIHCSNLAWKIPWTEEPDRLLCMGLQRVRHDWASMHACMHPTL